MNNEVGKFIVVIGAVLIVVGGIVYFFGDKLNWFGNLPGDIKVEKENFKFYFPITTMVIISLVLTLLINFLKKFF